MSCPSSTQQHQRRQIIGKYELGKVLAAGDFDCRTRICSHVVTGAEYVVRIYNKALLTEAQWMWNRVRESIHVLRTLPKHENIVEMVECFETTSSLYILMQLFQSINATKMYAGGVVASTEEPEPVVKGNRGREANAAYPLHERRGHFAADSCRHGIAGDGGGSTQARAPSHNSLSNNHASSRRVARITLSDTMHYFTQVVQAILHMHSHNVVHTGIAPDHIMINERGVVKVGNLVSICNCQRGKKLAEQRGTRQTVAPEILKDEPYDPYLADSWSLGVLLYFMLNHGRYPFDGANTLKSILAHRVRPMNADVPVKAKDLILQLLQPNPRYRLTVEEILQHPFFESVEEDVDGRPSSPTGDRGSDQSRHRTFCTTLNALQRSWSASHQVPSSTERPTVSASLDAATGTLEIHVPPGISQEEAAACLIQHAYRAYQQRNRIRQVEQRNRQHALMSNRWNTPLNTRVMPEVSGGYCSERRPSKGREGGQQHATRSRQPRFFEATIGTTNSQGTTRSLSFPFCMSEDSVGTFCMRSTTTSCGGTDHYGQACNSRTSSVAVFEPGANFAAGQHDSEGVAVGGQKLAYSQCTNKADVLAALGPVNPDSCCPLCYRMPDVTRVRGKRPYESTRYRYMKGEYCETVDE